MLGPFLCFFNSQVNVLFHVGCGRWSSEPSSEKRENKPLTSNLAVRSFKSYEFCFYTLHFQRRLFKGMHKIVAEMSLDFLTITDL